MDLPTLAINLERRDGDYLPGEALRAGIQILDADDASIDAIECSVLWFTVGKGEEDLAVHHFQRSDSTMEEAETGDRSFSVECTLPASPLSYEGVIVKICWCVRARLFLHGGHEVACDAPFRLGNVPAAAVVES